MANDSDVTPEEQAEAEQADELSEAVINLLNDGRVAPETATLALQIALATVIDTMLPHRTPRERVAALTHSFGMLYGLDEEEADSQHAN
jgi:hypothetical protein